MRRRFAQALRLFLSAVDRGLMATIGGRHRETWMAVALCAYVAVWTVYGVLAKASQDIHPDMAELVIWSRELAFGYPKHPPFAAWLTKAWFELFPLADWSFYLLGMSIVGLALFTVWRLAEDYVSNDKRVLAVALLTLVPFYNFHALKLNANSILIPLWALTTLAFLRSFERRSVAWSTLAGLFAAAAVLGKYWSFFLLAGLFLAAVVDSRRVTYFRSCAPWVTALVGIAAVTPHVIWLFRHDFIPFTYAFYIHGSNEPGAARGVLGYLAGAAAYVAVPAALAVAATRPHRAALLDLLWPTEPKRRLVVLAFLFPLLLPIVAALLFEVNLNALWTMPAWTLFPIVLLSPPLL